MEQNKIVLNGAPLSYVFGVGSHEARESGGEAPHSVHLTPAQPGLTTLLANFL